MTKDHRNKIILLGLILFIITFIIMVSGCTTPKYPVIYIHQSDLKPDEVIDGYITNFPYEYPRFEVVTREDLKVNGLSGERLVYTNTAQDDFLLVGPDFFSTVVVFQNDNQTYIISSSEAMESTYYSKVEPALAVLMDSVKIKE